MAIRPAVGRLRACGRRRPCVRLAARSTALLRALSPMLASAGPIPATASCWAFEPKLDGWRALVYVDGDVDIRTRSGRSIRDAVPEIALLGDAVDRRRVVLDGELVAGQGRPSDFYRIAARVAARRPPVVRKWRDAVPLTFVAFDVLHLDGDDLITETYEVRREVLESLALSDSAWCTVAAYRSGGAELLAACAELDLEGVVAKRLASRYRPGDRSRDWIKVKTPAWREHHAPRRHEHAHH